MEKLREAVSFIDRIFNVFFGKKLPNPTAEAIKNYPDIYPC
ncbi:hypothetical protein ACFLU1_06905 [Chloroflexota bacterium]